MRIISANITGSLILNGVDVTDSLVSSSIISSSVNSKLNSLQSSTSSLNSFTSSYSTGSFTGSFIGDGSNLYNIPATGVTGLQLDKIASGAVTASVSSNGFNVNSNVAITGSIVASGTSLVSGSSQVNITGTTGYSTFSSSISTSIGSLSSSVATTTVGTKNRVDSIEAKTGSYATTGSNTFIGTENITGNLTVTGSVIISSGSAVYNSSLNLTDTSSLTLNSGSNLYVYDSGIISGTFKGSVTGSLGVNGNVSITGSIVASGTSLVSGSSQIDITSTTNYTTFSSSVSSSIGNLSSSVATNTSGLSGRITTIEGRYATTGSNTFVGNQVITGSLYVTNDMIVQGCSCLQNITASVVSIGTNTVILNTATPAVRFAGISVQDSGSNAGVTGSIFWDGLCNRWVYSNPSGIGYSGGMLLSGPRTQTLGTESPLTCNYIAKSGGGDHLYDSCIIDDGTTVCVNATLKASGEICGVMGTFSCIGIGTLTPGSVLDLVGTCATLTITDNTSYATGVGGRISLHGNYRSLGDTTEGGYIKTSKSNSTNGDYGFDMIFANHTYNSTVSEKMRISSTGNVGIGCINPGYKLDINGNTNIAGTLNIQNANNINWNGGDVGISNDSTALVFKTYSSGTLNEKIRITCDGRMGINIISPQSSLHIIKSLGSNVFAIGEADSNIRFAIGQESGYSGNYINSSNIDLKLQSYLASGSGGNLYFQTANDGTNNVTTRLHIGSGGVASFSCQVCAPSSIIRGTINEQLVLDFVIGAGSYTHQSFRLCGTNQYRFIGNTNGNFVLRNDIVSSDVLTIACTGAVTFSSNVTVGVASFKTTSNNYGSIFLRSDNSAESTSRNWGLFWDYGNYGELRIAPSSTNTCNPNADIAALRLSSTGVATFASTVCAPNAVINCLGAGAAWSTAGGTYQPIQIKAGQSNSGLWVESCENDSGIYINHNSTSGLIGGSYRSSAGFKDLSFQTAGVTRMTIKCAGNVGIGCTLPGVPLVVVGACNGDTTLHLQNGSVSGRMSFSNNTSNSIYGGGWYGYMGYSSATYHYFAQCTVINGGLSVSSGGVSINTECKAFGRSLTAFSDIVAYYSNQESITMGLSAGTGAQSWGIQVCDTGDGGSALHLNARGGNVGINKGSGNVASHALDVTGVIYSTDRVQAPQIVAAVQKFSSTAANTFYTSTGGLGTFNIDIAGTTGLQIAGNYQTAEITFQAGLYPGSTTIIGKILVVNRGGAFSCSFYTSSGVGGVGTIGVVPYSNATTTFGVCLTSDCTSSAVYWSAIVNAMSV